MAPSLVPSTSNDIVPQPRARLRLCVAHQRGPEAHALEPPVDSQGVYAEFLRPDAVGQQREIAEHQDGPERRKPRKERAKVQAEEFLVDGLEKQDACALPIDPRREAACRVNGIAKEPHQIARVPETDTELLRERGMD